MSQAKDILKYLESGKKLDPLTAQRKFGTIALSSRISDLKKVGHDIKASVLKVGKNKWVAEYYLDKLA